MIKRLYNYMLLPEIPSGAKNYHFHFVFATALWACNNIRDSQSAHLILPDDGCRYGLREDGNAWTLEETFSGMAGTGFNYLYQNPDGIWVSCDIPNLKGETVFRTSDRGFVEYGWSDGGEGDALSVLQFTVPQGFHSAGEWKCIVSGTDSPVAKMEWYRNNVLISTETGKSESECIPTADNVGVFTYKCVITFENGKSVTAGDMTMVVEEYDPGEDPGGGGDPDPGGGGGGGDDETSLVTGIDLHVYPDTVVPGGHATIEVTVNGIGNYSKAFTARLSGHSSAETELFSAGSSCNVWIAEEETAEYVLVTVASVQDPTITATEMIYIDYSGTEDEGTTREQLQRAFWKGFAAARAYFQEAKVSGSVNIAKDAEPTTKAGQLKRSFWQGFVSALIVAAVETVDAVAYLYNGVKLPALPERDTDEYPYVYIAHRKFTTYELYIAYATKEKLSATSRGTFDTDEVTNNSFECIVCNTSGSVGDNYEWGAWSDFVGGAYPPIWSNYDVLSLVDGSVYLAASEPVPVYGEQVPDGVLISSDGLCLQDSRGLYLIAKEDS